jgi:transcriptional regulator with XRE-family HTH domain
VSVSDSADEWVGVGNRIRLAREAAHMSVRGLARQIDVSSSHVSQVERGLAYFSVRALYNVVSVLGISMDSLFGDLQPAASAELPASAEDSQVAPPEALDDAGIVLRTNVRPTIPLPVGTRWERLTPKPEVGVEFIEVVYAPSSGTEPPVDFIRHSSREYGVVIAGSLTVQVGFDKTVLHTGDSIAFDSHNPHRFWNETSDEVRAVWFICDDLRWDRLGGRN